MDDHLISDFETSAKTSRKRMLCFITIILILCVVSTVFIILYVTEKNKKEEKSSGPDSPVITPLSLWNEREPKQKLINFIQTITKEGSSDFIKNEDRIAVFDLDGTLFQETDPVYTDYKLFKYKVLDDPNYKDKATEEQKAVANEIAEVMKTRVFPSGLDLRHAKANAQIFKDMTIDEVDKYTKDFLSQPAEGYNHLKRGDAFYKPMLEVIDYLQKNNFTVYIVSGSDRFTVRSIVDGHINIPKTNIIGSEAKIIGSNQGDIDGFDYLFKADEELIYKGELVVKNLYMNKVYHIIREIGKIPILSFGNSSGDSSMANFVLSNKNKKSLAFMLLCDDLERENGDEAKAEKMKNSCNENNWIPVSMKNDWKTIYGEDVTRKKNE